MMGVPALICGLLFQALRGTTLVRHGVAGAVCGGLGTLLAALVLAALLTFAGEDFFGVAKIALLAHVPVFFVEAGVSAFAVTFLFRVKPELLDRSGGR
jgi:cobalt/nickel transport system permease protein